MACEWQARCAYNSGHRAVGSITTLLILCWDNKSAGVGTSVQMGGHLNSPLHTEYVSMYCPKPAVRGWGRVHNTPTPN